MDTLYGAWHFVLAGILGIGAFIGVLVNANRNPNFLQGIYWAWLAGAVAWLGLTYMIQTSSQFDFLWAKVAVAIGVLSGVVFGGMVAIFTRGK